jgi:hypothetical protein
MGVCLWLGGWGAGAWAASSKSPAVHPWCVYQHADRAAILAHLHPHGAPWIQKPTDKNSPNPVISSCCWWANEGYEAKLDGKYKWEGPKSEAMLNLAMIVWLEPTVKRPAWVKARPENATLVGMVRTAVGTIAVPKYRVRDYFPDNDDPKGQKGPGPWGRYLDASIALWHYALAYDLLASPEVAAAGLPKESLDDFYARLADGALHLMVRHLATYNWKGQSPVGNNWNSREMAGVGMACLAMKDRLLAEPAGSQRRQDYELGLQLIRQLAPQYLKGWDYSPNDADYAYYYEGPHYLYYWVQFFLPFAVAHERLFPEATPAAMSLAPDQPLARFLRTQTLTLMPTMHDAKTGQVLWSAPCIDDSWLEPETIPVPALQAAAWIAAPRSADRRFFLQAAKRGGSKGSNLLLGNPVLDELAAVQPADLPPVVGLPYGGLAVARTSSQEDGLSLVLKNTLSPRDEKTGVISLFSHSHCDNGEVVAYRNAEPLLIDPGYGPNGYGNPDRYKLFTPPQQHNVLMVEDPAQPGQFALPVYPAGTQPKRITRCEQIAGPGGPIEVLEATTPAHRRTVILIDAEHLLVVDRLLKPQRVQLGWFGHGALADNTAKIDADTAQATYIRGPSLATRITVLMPGANKVTTLPGDYGFEWSKREHPLSGMFVTSAAAVPHAVTLVEVRRRAPGFRFSLTAEVKASAEGLAVAITSASAQRGEVYRIAADGTVSAGR